MIIPFCLFLSISLSLNLSTSDMHLNAIFARRPFRCSSKHCRIIQPCQPSHEKDMSIPRSWTHRKCNRKQARYYPHVPRTSIVKQKRRLSLGNQNVCSRTVQRRFELRFERRGWRVIVWIVWRRRLGSKQEKKERKETTEREEIEERLN